MASLSSRLRRRVLRVGAIAFFIVLAGATYQGVATALERREFPRPGGLVSVGDHQLHIYCTGDGSPTVVLEAPAAGLSAAWREVQARVSKTTRVCSYDRAGLGWSEAGDQPYDPRRVPEELHALLAGAREHGPYVVVGHGLGAAFARMFAARPDASVVALVTIAPSSEETGGEAATMSWLMPMAPWLARTGVLRAGRILSRKAAAMDGRAGGAVRSFLNRPDHLTRAAAELDRWDEAVTVANNTALRADVRLVPVGVTDSDRVAFLTYPPDVDRVAAAIEGVVRSARESSKAR